MTNLIIKKEKKVLFEGDILNIPIKENVIIRRSIDHFGDDDPCIIHQSYIIKELTDELLELFEKQNTTSLKGKYIIDDIEFLDMTDLDQITLHLKE